MPGKFEWTDFNNVDLDNQFFDSLKIDYPEFPEWFSKKKYQHEKALVFHDEKGIGAFVYLKEENEPLELDSQTLSAVPRLKIGTLRLAERFRGQRLGEGAIGVSLWKWQESMAKEIYVTVFEKHELLINLFTTFGFENIGKNSRGEFIFLKSRDKINYSTPKKAFPFINPNITKAGLIPIFDNFHDRLFPYSEIQGNNDEIEEITAGNGISKIFLASPGSALHYTKNEPVLIYRIFTGNGQKTYKSVVTSYCTVSKVEVIKTYNRCNYSLEDFLKLTGNKTVFSVDELTSMYNEKKNLVILELVYNGYFGKGNNINHRTLSEHKLFETYPYNIEYSKEDFRNILTMGNVQIDNIIID
ncbi:hypothetical protein [Enterococcus faecalis]|uniref:hypothetical protein n=1 Tax=Enterococcus faecalis TaxID=1351 RepID=UPI00115D174E|nr:hypothetical protein [Enterococcus faecalis]